MWQFTQPYLFCPFKHLTKGYQHVWYQHERMMHAQVAAYHEMHVAMCVSTPRHPCTAKNVQHNAGFPGRKQAHFYMALK